MADADRLVRLARARVPGFGALRSADPAADAPGVNLYDGRRTVRVSAADVKSALGLPSLAFEVSGDGRDLLARGRGHGHNVGLCQWGAKGLAGRGFSAEGILKHYYPGCELTRLE
jgi:stage II sporulation protein D